jgi:hypothetical protein
MQAMTGAIWRGGSHPLGTRVPGDGLHCSPYSAHGIALKLPVVEAVDSRPADCERNFDAERFG